MYVDFLSTGPAVAKTLRAQVLKNPQIVRVGDLCITDLIQTDGAVSGAVGFSMADGRAVSIAAAAIVLATGGVTRIYRRNSASANMGGDGHALALRAGAELMDMEFVQFFPIGISRHGSSGWTRSCGIRFVTSSVAGCSMAR